MLLDLKPLIPRHIDTFLNVGCGSGRDFIPFDGKLKLWGIDTVPKKRISWVAEFKNFTYEQCTVEQFTERLKRESIDLSHTKVYTCGVLMIVKEEDQQKFYDACQEIDPRKNLEINAAAAKISACKFGSVNVG